MDCLTASLAEVNWSQTSLAIIPLIVLGIAAIVWLFLRRTIRTRLQMARILRDDPQVNDWMIVFNWSRKILYLPTIIASLGAAGLMWLQQTHSKNFPPNFDHAIGGVWMAIFFVNFLVDEYEMNIKTLLLITITIVALVLWLTLMGWIDSFLGVFKHLGVQMNPLGYLLFAIIFILAIVISWVRGLFFYAALTPNYLNIQNGPNETSEQISREAFSTRIDTGDFLERLLGFGSIIVTFADTRRPPMTLLVGRIGKRSLQLESVRSHLAVETIRAEDAKK